METELKLWVFTYANRPQGITHELLSRFIRFRFKEYSVKEFKKVW